MSSVGTKLLPINAAVTGLGAAGVKTTSDLVAAISQVQATMSVYKDAMSEVDGQAVNAVDILRELAKEMGAKNAFFASECVEDLK